MVFCKECTREVNDNVKFCPHCGADLSESKVDTNPQSSNSIWIAPFLSFILCCLFLGQLYNRQYKKWLIFIIVSWTFFVVFMPISIMIYLFGIFDAYYIAKAKHDRKPIGDFY